MSKIIYYLVVFIRSGVCVCVWYQIVYLSLCRVHITISRSLLDLLCVFSSFWHGRAGTLSSCYIHQMRTHTHTCDTERKIYRIKWVEWEKESTRTRGIDGSTYRAQNSTISTIKHIAHNSIAMKMKKMCAEKRERRKPNETKQQNKLLIFPMVKLDAWISCIGLSIHIKVLCEWVSVHTAQCAFFYLSAYFLWAWSFSRYFIGVLTIYNIVFGCIIIFVPFRLTTSISLNLCWLQMSLFFTAFRV